jgi:hypothetical protein
MAKGHERTILSPRMLEWWHLFDRDYRPLLLGQTR